MQNTLNLPSEERYDYFLDLVAEEREVWILVNAQQEFLKLYSDELDLEALLVWPSEAFANEYAAQAGEALQAKSIALPQFFMKWVGGLTADGLWVNVFPGAGDDAWVIEPQTLKQELQEAINAAF